MQYTEIFFSAVKFKISVKTFDSFNMFAQIIDCGYTLVTRIHNLCFRLKIRKIGIPCKPQLFFIKVGITEGVYLSQTCFPDVAMA